MANHEPDGMCFCCPLAAHAGPHTNPTLICMPRTHWIGVVGLVHVAARGLEEGRVLSFSSLFVILFLGSVLHVSLIVHDPG